jgi:hypothetical protein
MTYAFLKAMGCDGAIGTITVDLAAGKAEGTAGQKIVSCQNGIAEVESTRYPFCFQGAPDKTEQSTASILNFLPFNADLNRYLLVVKGLKSSKAKVTWGSVTKEFSADDLANGINLAAEFLINPFCDQFHKVDAVVQAQQEQGTKLVRFLQPLPDYKIMAPNSTTELDKVFTDGMEQQKILSAQATASVVPIHHTIKVEPEP